MKAPPPEGCPMNASNLAQQIASIQCVHGKRIQDRPCGKCVARVTRSLTVVRPKWVEATAKALIKLDGFDCPPTPLTLATALDLLKAIVPVIRGDAGTAAEAAP